MDDPTFNSGALDQPEDYLRPDAPQDREIAQSPQPAKWVEKKIDDFITYPKRDQRQNFTCVAHWLAKQLSVDELSENGKYRELSPRSIYPFGKDKNGGMNSLTAGKLAVKQGMTLESLLPSDGLTEDEMSEAKDYALDAKNVALIYRPQQIIECAVDFDTIANILYNYQSEGKKKTIGVTLTGQNNGTWFTPFPLPPKSTKDLWYHKITITDFGYLNGKPVLAFDNSMGERVGNKGQQFLGKQWEKFLYAGMYTLNTVFSFDQTPKVEMFKHRWMVDLSVGMTNNDVLMLQKALQAVGMFPLSTVVAPTGYFGGITKEAVELFQQSFGLKKTGVADLEMRKKLNSLFI